MEPLTPGPPEVPAGVGATPTLPTIFDLSGLLASANMYVQFSAIAAPPSEKIFRTSSSSDSIELGLVSLSSRDFFMNSSACTPPPLSNAADLPSSERNLPPKAPSSWVQSQISASACFQLQMIGFSTIFLSFMAFAAVITPSQVDSEAASTPALLSMSFFQAAGNWSVTSVTIFLVPNSAGQITSMSTTSYVPAGAAVTILSWSASYATNSGFTLIFGLAAMKSAVIPLTSSSEYAACCMNSAVMVPSPEPLPPDVLLPPTSQPPISRPAPAAADSRRRSRRDSAPDGWDMGPP